MSTERSAQTSCPSDPFMGDLTQHFSIAEFESHDGRRVPEAHAHKLRRLCLRFLEPLRSEFGTVYVFSGYRSDARNAQVGGAQNSYHRYIFGRPGAAADVACARGTADEWYRYLDRLGAPGLGRYPTYVHVDTRAGHARW